MNRQPAIDRRADGVDLVEVLTDAALRGSDLALAALIDRLDLILRGRVSW